VVIIHTKHFSFKQASVKSAFSVVVVVSKKKVKKAVDRNKIKRILRDLFYNQSKNMHGIVYVSKSVLNTDRTLVKKEVITVITKLNNINVN
jgi:ribonuclease P protein component